MWNLSSIFIWYWGGGTLLGRNSRNYCIHSFSFIEKITSYRRNKYSYFWSKKIIEAVRINWQNSKERKKFLYKSFTKVSQIVVKSVILQGFLFVIKQPEATLWQEGPLIFLRQKNNFIRFFIDLSNQSITFFTYIIELKICVWSII